MSVVWAGACLSWARLTKQLGPFLQWTLAGGALCVQLRDNLLRQAVASRYKDHNTWALNMLHDYFTGKWWAQKDQNLVARLVSQDTFYGKCYNRRKLDELPYQCFQLDRTKYTSSVYLTDLNWIFDKICGSSCYQLLEDVHLAKISGGDNPIFLETLEKFLEIYGTALNYDGRQFYSHLNQYLEDKLAKDELDASLANILEVTRTPPVTSLIVTNTKDLKEKEEERHEEQDTENVANVLQRKTFDLVTRLNDTDGFVVTVSTEKEEICVWNVERCSRVRTLRGVPQPTHLIPMDSERCVVLCRRELRVYNLESGQFVTKLKGVMNQKMPYYGLHDSSHLVALSRNRMYVNLMNMETGDCVTTFKAGEDRFLNSLLVSGDGRVLVCGDETQKPFPLLVWNLQSRKLLYDLRIPHHDFITNLSAITHEGSYVCCVCHEIDEPAPNFIVVYDLQSGTLFKKWKPSCNTVSLEISSAGGCVISGLEDARILVWDLITGNCRWSLYGHTAPVSFLRLDPTGGFCLSTDSQCRDRSIRLWDINKGCLVSVYTPNANISACELTYGGRFLLLALEGHDNLVALQLRGGADGSLATSSDQYGHPDRNGKVFDLKESEGAC